MNDTTSDARNAESATSEATTQGIRIRVHPEFCPVRSRPHHGLWFFLYTVTITNEGPETVQLQSRHWIIEDNEGHREEVKGTGVVGEQPTLSPGQAFEYTSGCPLRAPEGSMMGFYQMAPSQGKKFDAEIPRFELIGPYTVN